MREIDLTIKIVKKYMSGSVAVGKYNLVGSKREIKLRSVIYFWKGNFIPNCVMCIPKTMFCDSK